MIQKHGELFDEAVRIAAQIDIEPSRPRIVTRQLNRSNASGPNSTPDEYYLINLTCAFLDHVLEQLRSRFPREAYTCYKGFSVMPSILLSNLGYWKADLQVFTDLYTQDLPNPAGLSAVLFVWERLWIDKRDNAEDIPDKIATALKLMFTASPFPMFSQSSRYWPQFL